MSEQKMITPPGVGETGIIEQEFTLAGTRALVTGASRDIGADIALSFLAEGIDVLGVHRDPGKKRKANTTRDTADLLPGNFNLFVADITTEEGLGEISSSLGDEPLDFLVLSASGKTREINVTAAKNLVDLSVPRMKKGSAIVLMQSVPGHFAASLENSPDEVEFYRTTAQAKREGEDVLRKRIIELEEQGIKVFVICPPIVPDTNNMTIFMGKDDTVKAKHAAVSDKLGLPHEIPSEMVGKKVVEILKNKDTLPSGYTEFFTDGTIDARTALERVYDAPRIYVDTAVRVEDTKDVRRGISRSYVSDEQTRRTDEPLHFVDRIVQEDDGNFTGIFTPRPNHATGHFKPESNLGTVLAGHKQIRSAVETVQALFTQGVLEKPYSSLSLQELENVKFLKVIPADGTAQIAIHTANIQMLEDGKVSCSIMIKDENGETLTSIDKMVLQDVPVLRDQLLPDQLIEGMAQATGITALDFDGSRFPLFKGIRHAIFRPDLLPGTGDGLVFASHVTPDARKGFNKFEAYSGVALKSGELVGAVEGVEVMVFPMRSSSRLEK